MPANSVLGGGRRQEAEVVAERLDVDGAADVRVAKQGFDLGAKDPAIPSRRVVERLFARAVAGEEETPTARIPDRESKHAVKALETRIAVLAHMRPGRPLCRSVSGIAAPRARAPPGELGGCRPRRCRRAPSSRRRCSSAAGQQRDR